MMYRGEESILSCIDTDAAILNVKKKKIIEVNQTEKIDCGYTDLILPKT